MLPFALYVTPLPPTDTDRSRFPSSGTSRLVQPRDLFTHPKRDKQRTHPYYINYVGTKNVIEAAEKAGVRRLVRISGLSVGLSAFNPFTYLLNLLASMSVK